MREPRLEEPVGVTTPTLSATLSTWTCTCAPHAHVEDNIKRLKDSGAARFPFVDIDANRSWLAVVCFADSLVRWFQLLCLTGPALAAAEPKTLRWGLWHAPARLVHHARRRIVRILDGWPTTGALLDACQRIALIT